MQFVVLEADACLLGPREMTELSDRLTYICMSVEVIRHLALFARVGQAAMLAEMTMLSTLTVVVQMPRIRQRNYMKG